MTPGSTTPDQTRNFLIIMWVGMVSTLPLYYFITTMIKPTQSDPNSPLIVPMLAVAVLMLLLSFYVKARFCATEGRARSLSVVRTAYILSLVCTEIPALLGVIIFVFTGWPKNWTFFLISATGYVLNFPKRDDFETSGGKSSTD